MKRGRFFVLLLVFLFVGALMVAGCDTADPPADDDDNGTPDVPPGEFKTIRVGYFGDPPPNLDPANHRSRGAQTVIRNFTDGLYQAMSDGSLIPDLAESITEIDPLTYEIKLRQGVTFHNGDPMTAEDVVFSIQRLAYDGGMEGETSPRKGLMGPIESAEVKDDYTVIVNLSRPDYMHRRWYNVEIMPKKYFEEVGADGFFEQPIGVGPFKVVEVDLPSSVVLERYEGYYGGAANLPGNVDRIPAVDRVIFYFIPDNTTRVAALLAGDIDIMTNVPADTIPLLQADPNISIESEVGSVFVYLAMNVRKAPFDDRRVRQAIAYAINYDLLTEQLFLGYADPKYGVSYLEPYEGEAGYGQFGYESPYRYDPDKARALLEEAGASGFTAILDTHTEFQEQVQAVAQMLGDVGLNISVRVWEFSVLRDEFKKWERDMIFNARGMGAKDPLAIDGSFKEGQVHNFCGYSNPTFDDLIARARVEGRDSAEGRALFFEALDIIMEDIPMIALYSPRVVDASRANVKNFYPSVIGRVNLHRVDLE